MKVVCLGNESSIRYRCYCDLTDSLDVLTGIADKETKFFGHYIELDKLSLEDRILAIRVPGCTVGSLRLSKDSNNIEEISLGISSLVTYPDSVSEIIKSYVGKSVEFENFP